MGTGICLGASKGYTYIGIPTLTYDEAYSCLGGGNAIPQVMFATLHPRILDPTSKQISTCVNGRVWPQLHQPAV